MKINNIILKTKEKTFFIILLTFLIVLFLVFISPLNEYTQKMISAMSSVSLSGITFFVSFLAFKKNRNNNQTALAWKLLTISFLFCFLAEISWEVIDYIFMEPPFPSIADLFYVLFYPSFFIGILAFPTIKESKNQRISTFLEIGAVLVAMFVLFIDLYLAPMIAEETDIVSKMLSIFYPLGDFLIFWAVLVMIFRRSTSFSIKTFTYLAIGVFFFIITDLGYAYLILYTSYDGGLIDLGWIAAYASLTIGIIHYLKTENNILKEKSLIPSKWSSYLPFIFLLIILSLLVISYNKLLFLNADHHLINIEFRTLSYGIIAVVILIILKQIITLNENHKLNKVLFEINQNQENIIAQRTFDLKSINENLQNEIIQRIEAEEKTMNSLKEKELLLKEVHHRVKNNLQIVSSLIYLQSLQIDDEATKYLFSKSLNRIKSMALVHEFLYQSPDLNSISFKDFLNELIVSLRETFYSKDVKININVESDEFIIFTKAIYCSLIINELISNALKYAFIGREKGEITVGFKKINTNYMLSVSDNGVGIKDIDDMYQGKSLGVKIIKSLTDQLKGTIKYHSNQGTTIELVFPGN